MVYEDSYNNIFGTKQKIMIIMAHPDDAEIYAGGTIARLVKDGKEVQIIKMTLGNKGSRQEQISELQLKNLRLAEDKKAMSALGINETNNIYLDFNDGEVQNSLVEIEALVRQIRHFKPELIITHNPEHIIIRFDMENSWVNHRDHRNTGKSAIDAAYPYSRDILFFPEQLTNNQLASYSTTEFLLVDYYDHIDTISIDVTNFIDIRTTAIACHNSQYSEEKAQISTDFFTKLDDSEKRYERFRHVVID